MLAPKVSLSDLPKGSEVGIAQLDTFAGLLYGMHPNIVMHVYESKELVYEEAQKSAVPLRYYGR